MIVVILEGLNGTGKTKAARALAFQHEFRLYRPLRESVDAHWKDKSSTVEAALRSARVPYNSYIDDVYAVDALAQLAPEKVVLDRSMPSALAYGILNNAIKGDAHRDALETYWLRRVQQIQRNGGQVFYFWLIADHDVARARASQYPTDGQLGTLDQSFERSFVAAQNAGLKAFKVSTNKLFAIDRIKSELPSV